MYFVCHVQKCQYIYKKQDIYFLMSYTSKPSKASPLVGLVGRPPTWGVKTPDPPFFLSLEALTYITWGPLLHECKHHQIWFK